MASGTIKRIQRDKGFGFIRDTSGQEYFFHRSAVQGSFDSLSEGQRVAFDEEQSPKGPRAGIWWVSDVPRAHRTLHTQMPGLTLVSGQFCA